MADMYLTIIGRGIIGEAIAFETSKFLTGGNICIIDKNENFPGENQSSRNSGVIHAGIYYDQPLKARLCVEGNKLLYAFCEKHDVPYKNTGKLIVATNEFEDSSLDNLLRKALRNEVQGIQKIDGNKVKEYEANVQAYSALWVPSSGIVDPTSLVKRLHQLSSVEEYALNKTKVIGLKTNEKEIIVKVRTEEEEYEFTSSYVVNAAGLYSDRVAKLLNPDFPLSIFPVRGETAKFYQKEETKVSRNVYPTPYKFRTPSGKDHTTLGVHLSPTLNIEGELGKEVTVGPLNRKRGVKREDYGSDLINARKFFNYVNKFFPYLRPNELLHHQTGIQAILSNGDDFHIAPDILNPRMINVLGICSPGLTASLALAKEVKNLLSLSE